MFFQLLLRIIKAWRLLLKYDQLDDKVRFCLTNKNNVFAVVAQDYNTEAHNVYVIIGNVALLKCEIPSFVADFVSVVSWTDEQEIEFFPSDQSMGKLVNN